MRTSRLRQVTILGLTSLCMLTACHHGRKTVERKQQDGTIPVANAAADTIVPGVVVAPGIVEAWNSEVRLSALEEGAIAEIAVAEGQVVARGDMLARLEDEQQHRAVEAARAAMVEAQAELNKLLRGATAEELQQAAANYEAAAAQGSLTLTERERAARLHDSGALSRSEFERAATMSEGQAATIRAAGAIKKAVERGARVEDRAIARARLAVAQARLAQAETALARRRIIAPIAGTVLLSRFHVGEYFRVGSAPVFILGDVSRLQVRLEVNELDSPRVVLGSLCQIFNDEGKALTQGSVVHIAPKMGRALLERETPTDRNDVRVREVLVEVPGNPRMVPGQRVWGRTSPTPATAASNESGSPATTG